MKQLPWRDYLRQIRDKYVVHVLFTFTLAIITAIWAVFVQGSTWFPSGFAAVWGFFAQPVQIPLIVLIVLVLPFAVGVLRWLRLRRGKRTVVPQLADNRMVIGGLVRSGPGTYQVKRYNSYGTGLDFIADGPLCSNCLAPLVSAKMPVTYDPRDYQCVQDGCVGRFQLPSHPDDLKKKAEFAVEGAWRKALSQGKQPILDPNKWFEPNVVS